MSNSGPRSVGVSISRPRVFDHLFVAINHFGDDVDAKKQADDLNSSANGHASKYEINAADSNEENGERNIGDSEFKKV